MKFNYRRDMETEESDNYNLQDKLNEKDYRFYLFRNALINISKWIEMSSLFIHLFYSDTFFEIIQEKIKDLKQISCIPFVLLSIFMIDMEILDSETNFQYTFVSKLQQYICCIIDSLTGLFSSREIIKKLAYESFDSLISILNQGYEQTENGVNRFTDYLSVDDKEEENDGIFDEAKQRMLNKLNQRKCLLEKYFTCNWTKIIEHMEAQHNLKLCLVQDSEKSIQIVNQIIANFDQLKVDITSMKQTVKTICQTGIDQIDTYVSKYDEINVIPSNFMKIEDDELFNRLNDEMCKANFADFPVLFDQFY